MKNSTVTRWGGGLKGSVFSVLTLAAVLMSGFFVANSARAISTLQVNQSGGADTGNCVEAPCVTINYAISQAISGNTINVAAGTYPEVLNFGSKTLTIEGAGVGSTIVDASALTGYAIQGFGNGSVIRGLTLKGTLGSYGFKISGVSGITLENIKVENSKKTGVDLNGVNGATLTNVEVTGTVSGFGINMVDSSNVTLTNITTSGNAWGGVSVQTEGYYYTGGANNIVFSGSFNAGESTPFFLEEDPCRANGGPGGCLVGTYSPITNITAPSQFGYKVYGLRVGNNYKQTFYQGTLATAKSFAQSLAVSSSPVFSGVIAYDVAEANYYVEAGMKIQDAINAATAGDTIVLGSDITISSQVNINKAITLDGAGHKLTASFLRIDNSNNSAIGVQHSNVIIKDLTVDGTGGSSVWLSQLHGINVYLSTGVTLDKVTVSNFGGAGVIVNGSLVTVNNITTANNVWGGINVDQGSGVTAVTTLTVNGASTHTEANADIWRDDNTKLNVTVVDPNNQYSFADYTHIEKVGGVDTTITGTTYKLDTAAQASAETAVAAYEGAPITTFAEVTSAKSLKTPADDAVLLVLNVTKHDAFALRVTNRTTAIASAKTTLEAISAVNTAAATDPVIGFVPRTPSALQNALTGNATILGLDLTGYDAIYTGGLGRQLAVAHYVFVSKPGLGYTIAGSIKTAFDNGVRYETNKHALITSVDASTDGAGILAAFGTIDSGNLNLFKANAQEVITANLETDAVKTLLAERIVLIDAYFALTNADRTTVAGYVSTSKGSNFFFGEVKILNTLQAGVASLKVTKAETTKLQSDINLAQTDVTALSTFALPAVNGVGTSKADLQTRINAVQTIVDAETLATAKVTAHGVLTTALATYNLGNYSGSNWTALNAFKTNGDTAIDAAGTTGDVTSAQDTATTGMSGVKMISVTTVSCPTSVVYTSSAQTPCTVAVIGAGGISLTTPSTNHTANTNVGTANASYTFAGDTSYDGSSDSKTFEITAKAITVTATAQTKERGTSDPALIYTVSPAIMGGDSFGATALSRAGGEAIGIYAITQGTLTAGANYAITFVGADLTIVDTITPTISSYTVSETTISPNGDGIKDSSSINVAYSEQVSYQINIKSGETTVKSWSGTAADPQAKIWDGKNNLGQFVADGVYTIQVIGIDSAGLTVTDTSKTITVDTTSPVITITSYTMSPTNANITVNASTNEGILNFTSNTFTTNGSFNFVATDSVGNVTTQTVSITNIDKVAPTATVAYDKTILTNTDVIATITPSESVTITDMGGALTHTFTANGTFTFNFVDVAGNTGTVDAVVNNIDKTSIAPASFNVGSPTETSLALSWTNNESNGSFYTIKRSTSEITSENFASATTLGGAPTVASGVQGYNASNLSSGTTYYFAIRITDAVGNVSPISVTSGTTASADAPAPTDSTAPSAISNLLASAGTLPTSQVALSWSAVGDDGVTGLATKYIIVRSANEITSDNFASAITIFNSLSPKSNGSTETFTISNLLANTQYCFAIKTLDENDNSSISNSSCKTTTNNAPTATGITPTTGVNNVENTITITGPNFIDNTNVVRFTNSSNTFDLSATTIGGSLSVMIPIGVPTGVYSIRVTNNTGSSGLLSNAYTVTEPMTPLPTVSDVVPSNIGTNDADTSIEIYGKNFTGATTAVIDGVNVTLTNLVVVTDTKITATIPGSLAAGSYNVKITTVAGTNAVSTVKLTVQAPVVINAANTQEVTTSQPIDMGNTNTIPVQITMQSNMDTSTLDNNTTIEVIIPPATVVTDANGNAYTGNINPPQLVKPTAEIIAEAGADAVVITMGNPDEKINFSNNFVVTVTLETTNSTAPLIWYYNPSSGLQIAGKDGVKDGVTYVKGGTVLNTVNNGGTYTHTIGLLLDHMSSYVAGVTPTISGISPTSGAGGTSVIIIGTNFGPGATVQFGSTGASTTVNSVTQITAVAPSLGAGAYTVTVTNTDALGATSPTNFTITVSSGGGGGGGYYIPTPTPMPSPTPTPTPTPLPEVLGEAITRGNPANLSANGLKEGDTVSAGGSSDPDVYIVNQFGYKRLFLSPAIFDMYGHLKNGWGRVRSIIAQTRDSFPTTVLFRNCETNDLKVYALETTGEDIAVLHWVNITGDQAVAQDAEFFKKVFCINSNEFNWYSKSSTDFSALSQVPVYSRK